MNESHSAGMRSMHTEPRAWPWPHLAHVESVLMTARCITVEFSDGHREVHHLTTPTQKANHDHA